MKDVSSYTNVTSTKREWSVNWMRRGIEKNRCSEMKQGNLLFVCSQIEINWEGLVWAWFSPSFHFQSDRKMKYSFYFPQVTTLHTATEFNDHWRDFTLCISHASWNLSFLSIFSQWPLISGRIEKRSPSYVWPVTMLTVTSTCRQQFCILDPITNVISLRTFLKKWNSVFDIWTFTRKSWQ